ncbi:MULTISPECIES: hypothetical protein [Marinomonas]|uniref:Uncharacterized protein n=1 Tax=Marinomonas alcarazii TaxID=491949 RepID=A0A318UZ69_9GAMM|nr:MULTISPECIES: hypothetical protein [Marinomonas]PYF81694.1 hypothetical protein DFP75_104154 [Marinomonas alcarazii]
MYKVNKRAVVLVFILQIILGGVWYVSAPSSFLDRLTRTIEPNQLDIGLIFAFVASSFVYLMFTAWLLSRVKGFSGAGRFFLVIGLWLFVVLPNSAFLCFYLGFGISDMLYFLSYGAVNSAIAAIILPLWRSSRSIFKD